MGHQRIAPSRPIHCSRNSEDLEGAVLEWLQWYYEGSGKAQEEIARTHLAQNWNRPYEHRHPKRLTRKSAADNGGHHIIPKLNMAFKRDTELQTEARPIDMGVFSETLGTHKALPSSHPKWSRHMKQDRGYITSATDRNQFDCLPNARKLAKYEHSCSTEPKVKYIDPRELTRFPSIGYSSGVHDFAADCHGALEEFLVE
jgi:hypothetical protein